MHTTLRERLMRRRGKIDPIWIYLGVGPGKSAPEPKPDREYYYKIRQRIRRTRYEFARLKDYDADLLAVAQVPLEHNSWLFQRKHLSALLFAYRSAIILFKDCPFPHTLSAVVRNEPYESHNLYLRTAEAEPSSFDSRVPLTSLPPFLAARISLDRYDVFQYKQDYNGHCYVIQRK